LLVVQHLQLLAVLVDVHVVMATAWCEKRSGKLTKENLFSLPL